MIIESKNEQNSDFDNKIMKELKLLENQIHEVNGEKNEIKGNIISNSSNNIYLEDDKFQKAESTGLVPKSKSMTAPKRFDRYGNPIRNGGGGQYHISFLDRVSKYNIVEVIKVDNYKEYNKMEDTSNKNGKGVGCCLVF